MVHKVVRLPASPRLFDPAQDAARLLGWFGMIILMVVAPLAEVVSRRLLFVLLPIGTGLLCAAFVIALSNKGLKSFRDTLRRPLGLVVGFLFAWAFLSLIWTPFPRAVAPRLIAVLATISFAAIIICYLPERRATRALYLLPAGLAVTALATLAMALFGPSTFRGGSEFDPSLLERSVLTLVVLVWPALGALAVFSQWRLAIALSLLVATALVAANAPLAIAAFIFGSVTFVLASENPLKAGQRAGAFFAGLVVVAPLLPFVLAPLAASVAPVGRSTVAAMADWRSLVLADNLRLLTGHGVGTTSQGIGNWLPPHTPRTTLFEVWYELGVLGALSLAGTLFLAFRSAGRANLPAAASLLAGMMVTTAIVMFGVATAQLWFVAIGSLQAVAFGLLCRSSRPDLPIAIAASEVRA